MSKSWTDHFNDSKKPMKLVVIGKCEICKTGDAISKVCSLTSPTTKTPGVMVCQGCLPKTLPKIPSLSPVMSLLQRERNEQTREWAARELEDEIYRQTMGEA